MDAEQPQSPDFKILVRELVQNYFQAKGRGLLLSRLGQALRSQGVDLQTVLAGRKLSVVIEKELGDFIELMVSPIDSKVVSAVPKGQQQPLVEPTKLIPALTSVQPSIPRIAPTVWAAFTKPIQDGYVRILELAPPSFSDISDAEGNSLSYCIKSNDLAQRTAGISKNDYEQQVFAKISSWLTTHGVDLRQITANSVSARHINSKKSLFDQISDRLNEDQKRRLSLPLDIVETLMRG